MPADCYFINATERQEYVDDDAIQPEDNLEEFGPISEEDLQYYKEAVEKAAATGKAVVASFGGTALGDIAFVPGMGLKDPKGIRNVAEWYMSTSMRRDYVQTVFEKQTDIAIANYQRLWDAVGEKVDVVFTCGTDFGTQDSQFCSLDTFRELWLPHYKRMNDWIHANTTWKVFKHTCGAVLPILPGLVEAGSTFSTCTDQCQGYGSARFEERVWRPVYFLGRRHRHATYPAECNTRRGAEPRHAGM